MNAEYRDERNHRPDESQLTAYVLGELDAARRAEIEAEVIRSEECRATIAEIRLAVERVTAALASEPVGELSPAARQGIAQSIEAAHAGHERPSPAKPRALRIGRFARPSRRYAIAAAVLAMFGTGALLLQPAVQSARKADRRTVASATVRYRPMGEGKSRAGLRREYIAPQTVLQSDLRADTAPADSPVPVMTDGSVHFLQGTVTPEIYQRLGDRRGKMQRQSGDGAKVYPVADLSLNPLVSSDRWLDPSDPPRRPEGISHNTEAYDRIYENPFVEVRQNPLSTFSIDVDTASYANVRRFLNAGSLPPKDAVRVEEMLNYFTYRYPPPTDDRPFAVHAEVATCPWQPKHRLLRIALKGREIDPQNRPASNLVFLVDVSGSMNEPAKLPLLKNALRLMIDKLGENDRVAMAVYAGSSGLVLPSTSGQFKETILSAVDRLQAGGSTNGASGIQLAYQTARQNLIAGGTNRVILATDGDFNVGISDQGALTRLIEDEAKSGVFLSVLGFGTGNLKDSTMEKLADRGNGNYAYIDTINEARKVLVEQMGGTLVMIAKDVKLQLEFNPRRVGAYRLIGYENRLLRNEDFNDDTKDAGEIGAGHTVTALYELVPAGVESDVPAVDELKYQRTVEPTEAAASDELLTLKLRYKEPDGQQSKLISSVVRDSDQSYAQASEDFRFAAAVAGFGLILRDSQYRGDLTIGAVQELAVASRGDDANGYRGEFIGLVKQAAALGGR